MGLRQMEELYFLFSISLETKYPHPRPRERETLITSTHSEGNHVTLKQVRENERPLGKGPIISRSFFFPWRKRVLLSMRVMLWHACMDASTHAEHAVTTAKRMSPPREDFFFLSFPRMAIQIGRREKKQEGSFSSSNKIEPRPISLSQRGSVS